MPEIKEETPQEAAKRMFLDCYPNWYDNGFAIKKRVACDYAKKQMEAIIKETKDEYTNDENHERICFWNDAIKCLESL